ncbi:FAD-binding oxidoreductase [Anaerospora hongkongensis]|uniref:FAD-binding oxidoreductase n=1 Tax=Anaerospora hongkongensis TaxID=244830 RepID=UPI00289C0441|nr:FAD-binding oxidoreductase [Anaerospora hongkongensis]
MTKYNPVTEKILAELKSIVGEKNVIVDEKKLADYSHDEVNDPHYFYSPEVVVVPENAEQIALVVKLANRELVPLVPRGAGTGLSCGAVPIYGGIVLTTDKLNKILKVDADSMFIEVEAGVRTSDVQNAAKDLGLYYPGDPCSGDSCYIGGNVATNAGGNKAVRYGTTRHQVYSMEVVTPTGEITTLGGRLAKCSTGYALEQLVIGSEGTLGIITKVTLKLIPIPPSVMDLLAVFPNVDSAIACVSKVIKAGVKPTCVEFMANNAVKCVERFLKESVPHSEDGNYLIIQVEADSDEELENKAAIIDELCSANNATEVLMADPDKIWKVRKSIAEAQRHECLVQSNEDVVVPLDHLPFAMKTIVEICEKYNAVTRIVSHAGDGNIHACIMQGNIADEEWNEKLAKMHQEIYAVVYPLGGRLSGEHGIGFKKKKLMEKYTDPVELTMMRSVKKALDPNMILNPGKLFDVE